jgi:HAMP domain-containing protein
MAAVLVLGTVLCFLADQRAGFIALSSLLIMAVLSLALTKWRYTQIRKLSQYLKRITSGEYALDVRDNQEGELSILKSEIYKVTSPRESRLSF